MSGVVVADEPLENLSGGGRPAVAGRLRASQERGLVFESAENGTSIPLEAGMTVRFPLTPMARGLAAPPHRVDLGMGQSISGRLGSLSAQEIVLLDSSVQSTVRIARAGVNSLVQRPGESLVRLEGFESLDANAWTIVGEASLAGEPRLAGNHSLRIPAGGTSLSYEVPEPFEAGRCEAAFHDGGESVVGARWLLELTFRAPNGPESVRIVLGWADPSLAVESPNGPTLAVQRLARAAGWHRLVAQFSPGRFEVAVDGNELAHGKGADGPLVALKLATTQTGREEAPKELAGFVDDLRLVRFAQPATDLEIDATQDEVRLITGDQLFGTVTQADSESILLNLDGRSLRIPWSETSGLYFRRTAQPGEMVSGPLVNVAWRVGRENDPFHVDRLEGALTGATVDAITLTTPYAGELTIPRDRLIQLDVLGRGGRLVLDTKAHHLGDEVTVMAPVLDPPQPEGGVLETPFELPRLREGNRLDLVLDVVQVAGEATDLPFATLVKKGELRTNVAINGAPFDYLNRHVTDRNETPARIRLAIPRDLLRPGRNVIRFEQVGIANNPNYLDDLGILGIALEVVEDPAARR